MQSIGTCKARYHSQAKMPRTKQHIRKQAQVNLKMQQKLEKLETKTQPTAEKMAEKKHRAKPRFRPITKALRTIRFEQRSTLPCMAKQRMRDLIRIILSEAGPDTWLKPATIEAIGALAEDQVISILREANERRMEALTAGDRKRQGCVQLMAKNVEGAFRTFKRGSIGSFNMQFQE